MMQTKIRCIVIDDDQQEMEEITEFISNSSDLQLVHSFTDPLVAVEYFKENPGVNIVFMDVDMPIISGIELAKLIRNKTDKLVFTTSHAKYALDAFEVKANDFLLKPYNYAKFLTTIDSLFASETKEIPLIQDDYFFAKGKDEDLKLIKIKYDEVMAFESVGNYVKIHLKLTHVTTRLSLKDVKELVENRSEFIQIHRSYLLSQHHIMTIDGNIITLANGTKIPVGESYRDKLAMIISGKILKPTHRG